MNVISSTIRFLGFAALIVIGSATASAQLDRVYDKSGENVSGTVSRVSKRGVVLKRGGSTQEFRLRAMS